MAKKKIIRYTLNKKRKQKTVLVPDRAIKVKLETKNPVKKGDKWVVKISYYPSRKESAKKRIKLVTVPKGAEKITLK